MARRDLSHPLVLTLAAAAIGVAYLVAAPETADMAGHAYRAWLWTQVGFPTWNTQWYGGHHMGGYSLLYPPLAALAGTRVVGVLAGVAAAGLFASQARRFAPSPAAAALASWLFLGGVMSNVVIGRMPFTLGISLAVAAWACAPRSRVAAAALSLAATWASPVAGLFLGVAAVALLAGTHTRARAEDRGAALALAGPAIAGGLAMAVLFPEGGTDRFTAGAFWPMLLISLGAVALLDPTRRAAMWAAVIYVAVLAAAFAIPNALGQNALRPGVVLGPALLVLFARPRAPRAAVVAIAAALVYLQWLPAVRAVEEARGDPSTAAAFHAEVRGFLGTRAQPGERLEVPLTRNHWEATYLAEEFPLARGWHRQLDRKVNPLFYDHDRPLTPERYERWLRRNAIRWVALPAVPLDFSAEAERDLLLDGLPFLRLRYRSAHWRVWELRDPEPPVSGAARLTAAGAGGFDLEAARPGRVVVRVHAMPYWTVADGAGCVSEDPVTGWTVVDVRRAGTVRVRAAFSARAALRRRPPCPSAQAAPTSAVSPPVGGG